MSARRPEGYFAEPIGFFDALKGIIKLSPAFAPWGKVEVLSIYLLAQMRDAVRPPVNASAKIQLSLGNDFYINISVLVQLGVRHALRIVIQFPSSPIKKTLRKKGLEAENSSFLRSDLISLMC